MYTNTKTFILYIETGRRHVNIKLFVVVSITFLLFLYSIHIFAI